MVLNTVKLGGLGIIVPSKLSNLYYDKSEEVTKVLVNCIMNQHTPTVNQHTSAEKRDIAPSMAKSWIRTKISFRLVRTTHLLYEQSYMNTKD